MINFQNLKHTLQLKAFSLLNIPMIFYVGPQVLEVNSRRCEIKIPLNYFTRNHLKSMYFGVLATGADCAGGLIAMEAIRKSGQKVDLIFKDFKADFLKRAEGDVHFVCTQGNEIMKLVKEALKKRERVTKTISIIATTPEKTGDEIIAKFELGLSLKVKGV